MKAELFSSDFIISFFIFLSAFIIIAAYYQNLQTDIAESGTRNDMYSRAINIASLLATTSGYPKYWDNNTVEVIGLYDSGKFNLTKFEELKNVSYTNATKMLGSGYYRLSINLKNVTGNIIQKSSDPTFFYSYGISPSNAEQIVLVKRLGVTDLEGNATKIVMEVILWA